MFQTPNYAKFLKDLCTNMNRLNGNERIAMGQMISAVLQKKIPIREKDPGMFSIPVKLEMFILSRLCVI